MTGENSFIHKAFRDNETGGTDFEIKVQVQKVLKKYGINCRIPSQHEKYFGVRPDLISPAHRLVVEINGSVHEKNKVILQDEFKMKTYKEHNQIVLVIDLALLEYLSEFIQNEGDVLETYISPILMNLKHSEGLKANF